MERSASTEAGPDTGGAPDARRPVTAAGPGLRTPDQPAGPKSWVLPMAVLVVGMFMSILDVTIVNVAIPAIQRDFGVALDDVLWVATAYTLTLGVVVPLSAWLGDRFGLARGYIVSMLAFAAGSALCGLAWSLDSLIAFRVIQAIPGGILPVITLTMVYRIVPKENIGAAMGMYGLGIIFAPAIGPTLGGYLVEYLDWRLIFFINVPIGILGAVAAYRVLPAFAGSAGRTFDVPGFLTVAAGLFALLLAFSEGEDWGWTSYPVLMLLVGGVLSLALFVVIELEVDQPLLDMRVFRYWPFTNSLLLLVVLTVGLFAVLFYVPVFLQQGLGLNALDAGLTILPQALVMGVLMPVAGRLYDKIGPRWLATGGLSLTAYGTYLLMDINPDMSQGEFVAWTCVRAAGMGLAMMPIMTAGLAAIPADEVNAASALNNVARQVSAAMGLAILTAVATTQQTQLFADRSALLPAIDPTRPEIAAMTEQGPLGLVGLVQRTQLDVLAASYSNMFLITLWVTVAGVALALLMRGRPPSADAVPETPAGDVRVAAPVPDDRPGSTEATTSGPAPGNGQVELPAGRETPAPAHR